MAYRFARETSNDLMSRGKNRYGSARMNAGQDFLPELIVGKDLRVGDIVRYNSLNHQIDEIGEYPAGVKGYWVTSQGAESKHNAMKHNKNGELDSYEAKMKDKYGKEWKAKMSADENFKHEELQEAEGN